VELYCGLCGRELFYLKSSCIFGFRKTIAVLQDLELISKGNDVFVFVMSQSVTVQMMAG
jgi:hypothetical protein